MLVCTAQRTCPAHLLRLLGKGLSKTLRAKQVCNAVRTLQSKWSVGHEKMGGKWAIVIDTPRTSETFVHSRKLRRKLVFVCPSGKKQHGVLVEPVTWEHRSSNFAIY